MTDSSGAPRRRLPLRYSLRVLLLGLTAFAIGFPIWYRWPYEEEVVEHHKNAKGQPDFSRPPRSRRVVTWQRQWGRGSVKYGMARNYLDGTLVEISTYRNDQLHGRFKMFYPSAGNDLISGQFKSGEKDGMWRQYDDGGQEVARLEYRDGRLLRIESGGGNRVWRVIEFSDADTSTIVIDGIEVNDELAKLASQGAVDDRRLKRTIQTLIGIEFVEVPLKDVVDFLSTQHDLPVLVDPQHVDPKQPITEELHGVPFSVALTMMTHSRGLACDYRYGCIWITSAEDGLNWRDPTGVADIVPPKDSQLARSWNERVLVEAFDKPLAEVIDGMIGRLAIAVDTSQIAPSKEGEPAHLVTATFHGMPFKDVLGVLLYKTRCRCRLEGETLVILPPDE